MVLIGELTLYRMGLQKYIMRSIILKEGIELGLGSGLHTFNYLTDK